MVREVLSDLQLRPEGSYIDCTLGEGGHTEAILNGLPQGRLLGIDLDPHALEAATERLKGQLDRATIVQGNFAELDELAGQHGFVPADGMLFDLGLSSLQLESAERGFSFRREARLDMRFDSDQETTAYELAGQHGFVPADGMLFDLGLSSLQLESAERGFSFRREARLDMRFDSDQETTAYEVVNGYPERSLREIVSGLGEEPRARRVAQAIVRNRPIETTTELADVVLRALGRPRGKTHPATRTFQAVRMAVNKELDNLQRGLEKAIELLGVGGRLVVISYHSLEDRIVKNTMRRGASGCICPSGTPECVCGHTAAIRLVRRRVAKPSREEVASNRRSRSARLRVAEGL
jgi:16S rRNA (cytosine1402-N4)-methyltransferase